eukprot:6397561-Karenia_brevis.AAC.1
MHLVQINKYVKQAHAILILHIIDLLGTEILETTLQGALCTNVGVTSARGRLCRCRLGLGTLLRGRSLQGRAS